MTGGSWLGYEVARRRLSLWRASGGALAARLGARRRPASIAAATRLAPRRAAPAPAEQEDAPVQVPGMTDAAARWLFLGELPDGVQPFLGGQPAGAPPQSRSAARAARSGGVRRGRVEEGPAAARTSAAPDAPSTLGVAEPAAAAAPPSPADEPSRADPPAAVRRPDAGSPPTVARRSKPQPVRPRQPAPDRPSPDSPRPEPEPGGEQRSTASMPVETSRLSRAPVSEPHETTSSTLPGPPKRPTEGSETPSTTTAPSLARASQEPGSRARTTRTGSPSVARTKGEAKANIADAPWDARRETTRERPASSGEATAPAQLAKTEPKRTRPKGDSVPAAAGEQPSTDTVRRSDRPTVARASTRGEAASRPSPGADDAPPDVDRAPRADADSAPTADRPDPSAAPTQRVMARSSTTTETPSDAPAAGPKRDPGPPAPPARPTPERAPPSAAVPPPKTHTRPKGDSVPAAAGEVPSTEAVRGSDRATVARAPTRGKTTRGPRPGAADKARPDVDPATTGRRPRPAADRPAAGERPGAADAPAQRVVARRATTSETPSEAPATGPKRDPESPPPPSLSTAVPATRRATQRSTRPDGGSASAAAGEQPPRETVGRTDRPTVARASNRGDSTSRPRPVADEAAAGAQARPDVDRAPRAAADRAPTSERTGPSGAPAQRVMARRSTTSEVPSVRGEAARRPSPGADEPAPDVDRASRATTDRPPTGERAGPSDAPAQRVVARTPTTGETPSEDPAAPPRAASHTARRGPGRHRSSDGGSRWRATLSPGGCAGDLRRGGIAVDSAKEKSLAAGWRPSGRRALGH